MPVLHQPIGGRVGRDRKTILAWDPVAEEWVLCSPVGGTAVVTQPGGGIPGVTVAPTAPTGGDVLVATSRSAARWERPTALNTLYIPHTTWVLTAPRAVPTNTRTLLKGTSLPGGGWLVLGRLVLSGLTASALVELVTTTGGGAEPVVTVVPPPATGHEVGVFLGGVLSITGSGTPALAVTCAAACTVVASTNPGGVGRCTGIVAVQLAP